MKTIITICLLVLMVPTNYIDIGVGVHSKWNSAELGLESPLFTFEAGYVVDKTTIYYQHTSGIRSKSDKYGINIFGVKYRIK